MDSTTIQRLKVEIDRILPEITNIRHVIHRNPEIAVKEYKTAELIRKSLKTTEIRLLEPFLETDVVGILAGQGQGKNVTLRADIDALPMQEKTGLPFASTRTMTDVNGAEMPVMHACGHDIHMSVWAGTLRTMAAFREHWKGTLIAIAQQAEEQTNTTEQQALANVAKVQINYDYHKNSP